MRLDKILVKIGPVDNKRDVVLREAYNLIIRTVEKAS